MHKTKEHSTFSNIFFFLKMMFKISPMLVIGECLTGLLINLPTRLIAVLGVKYVIDTVSSGENKIKIIYAAAAIAALLLISELLKWIYSEFFLHAEKEKMTKGLSTKFYQKAKSLDLESYDNPHFYSSFILAIEASSGNMQRILDMVKGYVGKREAGKHYQYQSKRWA